MRLIVLGPPGSGRSTQCTRLSEHLRVPHVSTGQIFRDAVRDGSLGSENVERMNQGGLLPDDIAVRAVRDRLRKRDVTGGFLLDGFPRTAKQALGLGKALNEDGIHLDGVLWIDVPDDRIVARVVGRRHDPVTGAIYHLNYAPPPAEVADRLVRRSDDTEDACRATLAAYHQATAPLREMYADRDLLVAVDGTGTADEVFARILGALKRT